MSTEKLESAATQQARELRGRLVLFGFPATEARILVLPRSTAWRGTGAAVFGGIGLLLAPAVGMVPPHAPWALAAVGIGSFFALRRWRERFTLLELDGSCPRCGADLDLGKKTPLRSEISVTCPECRHDSRLVVELPE